MASLVFSHGDHNITQPSRRGQAPIIDGDLRRPSVAHLLELEKPKVGLIEVLLGHAELDEAVIKSDSENLEILPVGTVPPNPTEILSSELLQEFIDKHRSEYSLIIFDSSPVLGLADAPLISRESVWTTWKL